MKEFDAAQPFNKTQLTKKKWNRSFDFRSQSNIGLGYQTKWNSHKEYSNGKKSNVSIPINNQWQVY